jgi:uncharacterized protein (TIGR00730 family)
MRLFRFFYGLFQKFLSKIKTRPEEEESYLKEPDYTLAEEDFLVQGENFRTGLWRALRVFYEYMRGFYAFKNVKNCITVFGSARFEEHHRYYRLARIMGRTLVKNGFTVMTGGGPGIMEAANRGAREAKEATKGSSISCNIELLTLSPEFPNRYVDRMIRMHYFFVRKVMLTKYSIAFIVMPGGLGTLDEFFEVTTLIQTGKLKNFPVILMGKDFWKPLIDFMENVLLKNNTIYPEDMKRLLITDSPEEAVAHIHTYLNQNGSKESREKIKKKHEKHRHI